MTLFIQKDTGSAGSGSVFPSSGSANLIAISNMDGGYNETDLGNVIQVMYTQSTTGPCPNRLNQLVNTDFPTPSGNRDILIVPSDNGFVLNNGQAVGPGITLRPNSGTINPANSVVVIYDTTDNGGQGVCVKREGGSQMDVQSPPSVILYHELSHALRDCTSSSLSNTEPDCSSASPEEHAAEVDENDMRDQLGIPHRDANNHCANIGCQSNCCIVASLATGSPYSATVNRLRDLRDRFLRRSEVGYDFFEHLHTDYYTFSPEVCGLMSSSGELRSVISSYFVRPLAEMLNLIHHYTVQHCSIEELAERFEAAVMASPDIACLGGAEIEELERLLAARSVPSPPAAGEEVAGLELLLRTRAYSSEFIRWALIEPLSIYLGCERQRLEGSPVGERLATAIDAWGAQMPITDIWSRLSLHDRREELEFLKSALLRAPAARTTFGERLLTSVGGDAAMQTLLIEQGFAEKEIPWQT